MSSRPRTRLLRGVLLDRHGDVLGRTTRMVLLGRKPSRVASIRGLAEVRPALQSCPSCYWLKIAGVGALRIQVRRFDRAVRGSSLMHFRVLSMPLRFPWQADELTALADDQRWEHGSDDTGGHVHAWRPRP